MRRSPSLGWICFRQAVVGHPRVVALRRRFAPQLEFFLDRLSPRGYLGLHLTIGVLLSPRRVRHGSRLPFQQTANERTNL